MLKTRVKTAVASLLGWTGAARVLSSWTGVQALPFVVGYHMVVEDVRAHIGRANLPNLISLDMLERQLDWIGQRYHFLTLDELGAQLESGAPFERPSAAVTFDDGYVSVYRHAVPLLKRKGIPAAVFVVTELAGSKDLQLYDKVYLLLEKVLPLLDNSEAKVRCLFESKNVQMSDVPMSRPLDAFQTMRWLFSQQTQDQIQRVVEILETFLCIDEDEYPELQSVDWEMVRMMDDGGITIGSHTKTHAFLTEESVERVVDQTVGSMMTLQDRLKRPIKHFAYPDGRFNATVVSAVAGAGYRYGYGTCLRRDAENPNLTIPRTLLWERSCADAGGRFSPSLMNCHAHRLYDLWARCSHNHGEPTFAKAPRSWSDLREGNLIPAAREKQIAQPKQHA
jgi:peptidoglycan/xylan/chitin deacetylase (PgdA/CDA1 family)